MPADSQQISRRQTFRYVGSRDRARKRCNTQQHATATTRVHLHERGDSTSRLIIQVAARCSLLPPGGCSRRPTTKSAVFADSATSDCYPTAVVVCSDAHFDDENLSTCPRRRLLPHRPARDPQHDASPPGFLRLRVAAGDERTWNESAYRLSADFHLAVRDLRIGESLQIQ